MSEHVCVICGTMVSKRASLAHGNGRACRTHSEVTEAVASRLEQEEKARKALAEMRKKLEERAHNPVNIYEWAEDHCWSCGCQGYSRQMFWSRMMVGLEKNVMSGGNVMDLQGTFKAANLQGVPLIMVDFFDGRRIPVTPEGAQLVLFNTAVRLCKSCAEREGVTDFDERFKPQMKSPTPEQLSNIVCAMSAGGFFEELKQQAKQELEQEKASGQ